MGIFAGQKGDPIPITYSAGNYTGSSSMTWSAVTQVIAEYCADSGFVRLRLAVTGSTVATVDTTLRFTYPSTILPAEAVQVPFAYSDNGTIGVGIASVTVGGTYISLQKPAAANWSASTTSTNVFVDITFRNK